MVRCPSSLPRVARYRLGIACRMQLQLAQAILDSESSPSWLPGYEGCFGHADHLFFVSRFSLLAFFSILALWSLCTASYYFCHFSFWNAMGAFGSASALPCLSQACHQSGAGGIGIQNLSGLERNRVDLRGRTHAAAYPRIAHQLVQYTALVISRYFLGLFICRLGRGITNATGLGIQGRT